MSYTTQGATWSPGEASATALWGSTNETTTFNTIAGVEVINNDHTGIHIINAANNTTVSDCVVEGNAQAGINVLSEAGSQLINNTVCGNVGNDITKTGDGAVGQGNRCDDEKSTTWADEGMAGCTYQCVKKTAICHTCEQCSNMLSQGLYDTVFLLSDINNHTGSCVTIETDDVTFDCQGRTITGDGVPGSMGITTPSPVQGLNIRGCTIEEFYHGMDLKVSDSAIIDNTLIGNKDIGMRFTISSDVIVRDNTFQQNVNGIRVNENSTDMTIESNEILDTVRSGIDLKSTAGNHVLNNNRVCALTGTTRLDIVSSDSTAQGVGNICDVVAGWDDNGQTGCTEPCNDQGGDGVSNVEDN